VPRSRRIWYPESASRFPVPIAREALSEIKVIYTGFEKPENLEVAVHEGGHVVDVPSLPAFFEKHLKGSNR
jgi:hypothetical protein